MRTTKRNKDFAELVDQLTDLSDRDFKEAIKIAKQFRKAQKSLQKAIERQQRERLPAKAQDSNATAGMNYEFAGI